VELTMVESIADVLRPLRETLPESVVVMSLSVMATSAPLRTMLVAIWPFTASD